MMKVVRLRDGALVSIEGPLQQQRHWLKGNYYESALLKYVYQHYRGGTFIDGGACIGNHTLFFAKHCADQVIAVEPVARNMVHLERNVALSGVSDKVTMIEAALWSGPGRGAMEHAGDYHGQYNLIDGDEVALMTIDAVAAYARHPITLIKLDIQWSEVEALQGATETLGRFHPVLFIEAVEDAYRGQVDAILKPHGYKRARRFSPSPTYEYIWRGNGNT